MSDKPTETLISAIQSYGQAFDKDRRFDKIRGDLARVRAEAEKLDPVADADLSRGRQGQAKGETRRGHGDEHRQGIDRNIEERGDTSQGGP